MEKEESKSKLKLKQACLKAVGTMEEGKAPPGGSIEMPNLPTPLTLQEKKYLLSVERGDIATVKKMLQKSHRHTDYMNMNCLDPLGRGALHMSIDNENLEMIELLVVMGVETRDALLYAIDKEFVEAVEVLLEHEEVIHKDEEPYSWEKIDRNIATFTPEITPLILAAHRDNYEILKILLDRGATLPMPHDIRCGCPECLKSSEEDSLRHSMSRINSYRALSSPSLIALSSTDPILTAFELSSELKNLAYTENEFRSEYLELRTQCRNFANELLSHSRTSSELAVILNHDPHSTEPYEDGDHMHLKRLELAIHYKQKKFVAHPNVQQLLAKLWYEGVPGFRRKEPLEKVAAIVKVVALFPLYCAMYMIMPNSSTGKLMRTPFMKFLIHSASYLFFLLLLILFSVRFEELVIYLFGTRSMVDNLEKSLLKQRGNLPTLIECLICIYVFGFIWEEVKQVMSDGLKGYLRDMWNILDIMRDGLYIMTMVLRVIAYIQQYSEIQADPQTAYIRRENWHSFDPQLISEGLFSAANILSALKLVHIFSINPYLGPLQISLGRMVIDIVKFFFIYTLVLFAFACGLTQLLWYYNDLEKQKCYSLPGGEPNWAKQGDACMKWRRFHNLFEASQSLFWAGFGMVGLSDFELTGSREYTRFWSMLMFGSYSVINIIVLLNLLIAMMSSSYAFIVDHADTEWKFARTKLWMSYFEAGGTLPPPFNVFPNVKMFSNFFASNPKLARRLSSKGEMASSNLRDYKYLSVMRALVWRYVASLQRKAEDNPVTDDDISEVKGDISSLRFELIELFSINGMDVSMCANKSKAALGRKMREWERRLMRDFHVAPAMGIDDDAPPENNANTKFKKLAKLAIKSKFADVVSQVKGRPATSQIGFTHAEDDARTEALKTAMERARQKMEADTPDGSPNSSRGCSPFPDLYTGPHLMDAIDSLDLSPDASPSVTPLPKNAAPKKDEQAKDPNMLTIPGRRSVASLSKDKDASKEGSVSISVPSNVFSANQINKLQDIKKDEKKEDKKASAPPKPTGPKPPALLTTVSEKSSAPVVKKEESKTQTKSNIQKEKTPEMKKPPNKLEKKSSEDKIVEKPTKIEKPKPQAQPINKKEEPAINNKPISKPISKPNFNEKETALLKSAQDIQPSKVKDIISKDIPPKINPPQQVAPPKRKILDANAEPKKQAPLRPKPPPEQEELESMDFVRRPSKPPPVKQRSKEELPDTQSKPAIDREKVATPVTPNICIIPSTPAPPESPEVVRKVDVSSKEGGQKPSTPPAAAFHANSSGSADEPLIKNEKKSGWI